MEKVALYKLEIAFLKIIPMVLAGCFLANTILSYFAIETEVLSYIAGIGILPLLFIYLSSFVFKFCVYHRMFIYYIFTNNIICFIDDKYGIKQSMQSFAKAFTISNTSKHISIVGFNKHDDELDYINSIVHEAEHVKQAMLKAYNIDESGEPPANTVAYIVEKMLQVFII